MMKKRLTTLGFLLAVFLFAGLGSLMLWSGPAEAAAQETGATQRMIQVTGNGRVAAQPDMVTVRLGVQSEADTAEGALSENSDAMTAVISATLEADIAEADIQTQGLNLQPVYDSSNNGNEPELTGYRASNIVQITVRDLDQLGSLLDAAVSAGGNTIEGIQFQVSNREELEADAREAAMNNAIAKAEQLTELTGAQLGDVLTISEMSVGNPAPLAAADESLAAASVPVQAGTQFIDATVQVSWEIQ